MKSAAYWIEKLGLRLHPEGGYFLETYRSADLVEIPNWQNGQAAKRSYSTSIYFLITPEKVSNFHRLKADEVWHFYTGNEIEIHLIGPDGAHTELRIGPDGPFQAVVPSGHWLAARLRAADGYALVGCTMAPGFDLGDFELAERDRFMKDYPQHASWAADLCLV